MLLQKLYQKVPELEKSTAVAIEKMRLEEAARRKLEERLITVSHQPRNMQCAVRHMQPCFDSLDLCTRQQYCLHCTHCA